MRILAAIATAAGVGALIAQCIANCLAEIDQALSDYTTELTVPDYVPTAWTVES